MQIYRGMDIGTAKMTPDECTAPLRLVDIVEPGVAYSAALYQADARAHVERLLGSGCLPVFCGGTGLYLKAALDEMDFPSGELEDDRRVGYQELAERIGEEELHALLAERDPESAAVIHPHNVRRVIRALEYCTTTGGLFSEQAKASQTAASPYDYRMLCLSCRDREALYARINRRVDQMLEDGLLEEACRYFEQCGTSAGTSAQAIGYKELRPYFEGRSTLAEAVENIKKETRRYAKRQLTWFRREENTVWLYTDDYPDAAALYEAALEIAAEHFAGGPCERKSAR